MNAASGKYSAISGELPPSISVIAVRAAMPTSAPTTKTTWPAGDGYRQRRAAADHPSAMSGRLRPSTSTSGQSWWRPISAYAAAASPPTEAMRTASARVTERIDGPPGGAPTARGASSLRTRAHDDAIPGPARRVRSPDRSTVADPVVCGPSRPGAGPSPDRPRRSGRGRPVAGAARAEHRPHGGPRADAARRGEHERELLHRDAGDVGEDHAGAPASAWP